MIYFTSDSHLFHKRIIEYEPITRPFSSVEEMNETIISNWNKVVKSEDEIFVLGDFIMGELKNVESTLKRLNGKITLVRGNHDTSSKLAEYKRLGIEVKDIAYIPYKGRFFICCHFPITNEEFIRMVVEDNSEVVFLYGHTHSNSPKGYVNGTYHIGADTNNLTPISIEQIWNECWPEEMMTKEIEEYKIIHNLHPELEQITQDAPNNNLAAATFNLNTLEQQYNDLQINIDFHTNTEKEIINNIYKNLIKEKIKL